jgi:hypothetical protein
MTKKNANKLDVCVFINKPVNVCLFGVVRALVVTGPAQPLHTYQRDRKKNANRIETFEGE